MLRHARRLPADAVRTERSRPCCGPWRSRRAGRRSRSARATCRSSSPRVADVVRAYAVTPVAERVRALDTAGRHELELALRRALGGLVDGDGAVRSTVGAWFLIAARLTSPRTTVEIMTMRNWAGNVTFAASQLHRPTTRRGAAETGGGQRADPRARHGALVQPHRRHRRRPGERRRPRHPDGRRRRPPARCASRAAPGSRSSRSSWTRRAGRCPTSARCRTSRSPARAPPAPTAPATTTSAWPPASSASSSCAVTASWSPSPATTPTSAARSSRSARWASSPRSTLELTPSFELRQDVWLDNPLDAVLDRLPSIMAAGYSVSLFTNWKRQDMIDLVWVKTAAGAAPVDGREWGATAGGHAPAPGHRRGPRRGDRAARRPRAVARAPAALPRGVHAERRPRAADRVPVAARARRGGDRRAARPAAAPVLQICEIRTIAADDLWLSPFGGRDTIAVHFTWIDDDAQVQPAVAAVEAALAPFDPRPHWGKVFGTDPARRAGPLPAVGRVRRPGRPARPGAPLRQRLPRALRLLTRVRVNDRDTGAAGGDVLRVGNPHPRYRASPSGRRALLDGARPRYDRVRR